MPHKVSHVTKLRLNCCPASKAGYTLFVFRISRIFSRNTSQNTKQSLYTFRISCKFRVLLTPQQNKPRNPIDFCASDDPVAKCEKQKRGAKREKRDAKYSAINFSFFAFHNHFLKFCNKCIADLRGFWLKQRSYTMSPLLVVQMIYESFFSL